VSDKITSDRYRVKPGSKVRLDDLDTGDTAGFGSKAEAEERLQQGVKRLGDLQEKLYAEDRWSLLLVFQAMDAAGKDSTIEHVMSGVNPQGCQVYSFKAPSAEELDHDFLWRTNRCLPERGRIGIFNRSYYEEVLVVRVHPAFLEGQRIPKRLVTDDIWKERFEDINAMERHLARSGTAVVKFFLHVSKEEQKERFLKRLDDPAKNWKFSAQDVKERAYWDAYMEAYEEMLSATSTDWAPWYVIPADKKWYARLAVADAIARTLEGLDNQWPKVGETQKKELDAARKALESEK
jgi:PPK2 family polyphosphate:nucleotide phosphotransferase